MNFQTMSKQRKFVLIASTIGIISMFLPWFSFFGYSISGMHGIGILIFLCFVVAGVVSYLGDQTKNLDKTMWLVTLICGALATLIIVGKIVDVSGTIIGLLSFGIYLAGLAAIGVLLSAFLLRSPTDTIKDGFESLKHDINTKINTTPTTQDVTNRPDTTTNNDADTNSSGNVKQPEDIDDPGK